MMRANSDYERRWKVIAKPVGAPSVHLRVMSYNVLADKCATRRGNPAASMPYVQWGPRSQKLLKEILHHDPDVVVLLEVDHHGRDTFKPFFANHNYGCLFLKRPTKPDGTTVLYKIDRLRLLQRENICFDETDTDEHSQTHDVAMLLKFEWTMPSQSTRHFVFATAHLNYKHTDIRNRQAAKLLATLADFSSTSTNFNEEPIGRLPIVVAGDFNSKPDSAVYSLFAHGKSNDAAIQLPSGVPIFRSAYGVVNDPPTHFTSNFVACIDYVWLSSEWQLGGILLPPASRGPFPDDRVPSDHISLLCEVALPQNSSQLAKDDRVEARGDVAWMHEGTLSMCKYGLHCRIAYNTAHPKFAEHTKSFGHVCWYGSNCRNRNDVSHRCEWAHEPSCPHKVGTCPQRFEAQHCAMFYHRNAPNSRSPCSRLPSHMVSTPKLCIGCRKSAASPGFAYCSRHCAVEHSWKDLPWP